jgi:hypothetical protein
MIVQLFGLPQNSCAPRMSPDLFLPFIINVLIKIGLGMKIAL